VTVDNPRSFPASKYRNIASHFTRHGVGGSNFLDGSHLQPSLQTGEKDSPVVDIAGGERYVVRTYFVCSPEGWALIRISIMQ
jgi:hypothetical protein